MGWRFFHLVNACLARLNHLHSRFGKSDLALAALLLAPALTIILVFGILPLFMALYMSLFTGLGMSARFAGLSNYAEALTNPSFWNASAVTLYYVLGTLPASLALSFVIASGLHQITKGRSIYRTLYFLPYVTSVVAAAIVWRTLLHPQMGIVNAVFGAAGIPPEHWPRWLLEPRSVLHLVTGGVLPEQAGPSLALCCIMGFDIWHSAGFMVVVYLAALAAIPAELDEVARLEGATWWQRTRFVTLPLISPVTFFLAVVGLIRAFQAFGSFYAMTGDGRGPYDTTQNLTVYIFSNLYQYQRLGYGAAVAVLLAVLIMSLTALQWRLYAGRVHYE